MTDTHAENGQRPAPAPVRTYSPAELAAAIDPSEYVEISFKDGDDSKKLKYLVAQAGLNWLYAERPMVFADMMLHVMGIPATAKPRAGKPK